MTWWNSGVKVVGPSKASMFFNIVPIAGMTFSVIVLGEHLGWSETFACLWIITGVYLSTRQVREDAKGNDHPQQQVNI